jgi:very-long-chain enoyl-CoA reductase
MAEGLTLIYKDLGLQISWKLVFLIEYFGPILITGILAVF